MGKRNPLGIVGLGRMGGPLAQRLAQAKFPLMVWDTVASCRKPFENKSNIRVATPGLAGWSSRITRCYIGISRRSGRSS